MMRDLLADHIPCVRLDGLSALVEGQQFLEIGLQHPQTGVDGGVPKAVGEEAKVGEAWVGVVGICGLDVGGSSHRI